MSFSNETPVSRKNLMTFAAISAVSFFISLVAWALSSPLGSSPDEDFHVGSIWCADGFSTDTCQVKEYVAGANQQRVTAPDVIDVCFKRDPLQSADCSWDPKSVDPELRANDKFQYPPFYYRIMHVFVDDNTQSSGMTMRLFNSVLACVLLFFAITLSSVRVRNSLLISLTVTLIPLALFLIPSLNPSSWAYMGIAFAWVFLMNALTARNDSDLRVRANWILFAVCMVMAIGSRWDSALYAFVSTAVVFYLTRRTNWKIQKGKFLLARSVAAIGLLFLIVIYLPKLIDIFTTGIFGKKNDGFGSEWSTTNLILYNLVHLIEIPAGIFGFDRWDLGWLDTSLPGIVSIVGIAVYFFFFAQSMPFRRRYQYLVVLFLVAFSGFVLFISLVPSGLPVGFSIQPRYILPMIPLILGIAIWCSKLESPFGPEPRARAILIGSLLAVAHAVSLWTNIRRYTFGLDDNQGFNLNNPREWWWSWAPSPNFVFIVGTISFAVFLYSVFKILLTAENSQRNESIAS
jgi:hypothetical protein